MSNFNISTDTFLRVGKQHAVCEDYILAGEQPFPYVILADGCSSSVHTDVGARLLCHSVKFLLELNPASHYLPEYDCIANFAIHNAKPAVDLLHINPSCLDATLIVAFVHENNVHVRMYGDGNIITVKRDNKDISLYRASYDKNAPDYVSYRADEHRRELYKNLQDNKRRVIKYVFNSTFSKITAYEFGGPYNTFDFMLDEYECVLVASDGIETFLDQANPGNGPLLIEQVIRELTAFKNPHGEFVKRRLKRMTQIFEGQSIYHFDDLSIGGFHT